MREKKHTRAIRETLKFKTFDNQREKQKNLKTLRFYISGQKRKKDRNLKTLDDEID